MGIKKRHCLYFIIFIVILAKTELISAASYEVSLNGIDYVCSNKTTSTGKGFEKDLYSSREEARIDCEDHQRDYINNNNSIYIFDDPNGCQFDENDRFYNCNCHTIVYEGCQKKNANQRPTTALTYHIVVNFMNESNGIHNTQSCTTTAKYCSITTPSYQCGNGKYFNGWISSPRESCNVASRSGAEISFAPNGKEYTYFTYYPCCNDSYLTRATATPTPNNTNNNSTNNNNSNNNSSNNNSSNNNNSSSNNNSNATTPIPTNSVETPDVIKPNATNNNSNNQDTKSNSSFMSIFLILVCILIITAVIYFVIHFLKNRNDDNNDDNDNSDSSDNYSNYYS